MAARKHKIKREDWSIRRFRPTYLFNEVDGGISIEAAILLTDLALNIASIKKSAKTTKEREGWYYASSEDLHKRHPYLSKTTISRRLKELRDKVVKGGKVKRLPVLEVTTKFNHWKHSKRLWYRFMISAVENDARNTEGSITYRVQDAIDLGLEAAILLHYLRYKMDDDRFLDNNSYLSDKEPRQGKDGWYELNPADLVEYDKVPLAKHTIKRALAALFKAGKIKRQRKKDNKSNHYVYRYVETHRDEKDQLPSESFDQEPEEQIPSESIEQDEQDDTPTEQYEQ